MSAPVQTMLRHLDDILDRLSAPEDLEPKDLKKLAQRWDEATARLDKLVETERPNPRQRDLNRARLKQIIGRLPDVQKALASHKSDVARQLFSENRRFQSLRKGYGSAVSQISRKFNTRA